MHALARAHGPQVGETLMNKCVEHGHDEAYHAQLARLFRTVIELCCKWHDERLTVLGDYLGAARRQWSGRGAAVLRELDPDLVEPAWDVAQGMPPLPPVGAAALDGNDNVPKFVTSDGETFTAAGMDAVISASSTLRAIGSMQYFAHRM